MPRCRVPRHDIRGIERTRANEAKLVFDEQVVVTEDADCPVFSGVCLLFSARSLRVVCVRHEPPQKYTLISELFR